MFAYCGNNPATTVDPSGNAWCKISFDAFSPFDSWYIPLGGGGMAAGNSFAASRAYQRENEEEPNAIFDTGDIDYGSFSYRQKALIWGASGIEPDSGGINIVNAEAALMSATISKNGDSLSFGDIGVLRANASFGILSFEVEALAAYWAPSAKIDLGLVVINLEAYLGGVGLTAEATSEELRFGIAAGMGFSAGIEWK